MSTIRQAMKVAWGRVAGRRAAPARQPFTVRCDCGAQLVGNRPLRHAELICQACGEALFVLGVSPYPCPPGWSAGNAPTSPPRTGGIVAPADSAVPASHEAGPTSAAARGAPRSLAGGRERAEGATADRQGQRSGQALPAKWAVLPWRWFGPLRLVSYAVLCVVLATAAWSYRTWRTTTAWQTVIDDSAAGLQALDAGQFVDAAQRLEYADRAARYLGGGEPALVAARQLYREAELWSRRAFDPLENFFAAAAADPPVIAARFADAYRGRSLIVDAWIGPAGTLAVGGLANGEPDAAAYGALTADWSLDTEQYLVTLDLGGQSALADSSNQPRRVVFAAEIVELVPRGGDPPRWSIRFRPDSAVLLTRLAPLAAQGWPLDDQLRAVLLGQAESIGIDAPPSMTGDRIEPPAAVEDR